MNTGSDLTVTEGATWTASVGTQRHRAAVVPSAPAHRARRRAALPPPTRARRSWHSARLAAEAAPERAGHRHLVVYARARRFHGHTASDRGRCRPVAPALWDAPTGGARCGGQRASRHQKRSTGVLPRQEVCHKKKWALVASAYRRCRRPRRPRPPPPSRHRRRRGLTAYNVPHSGAATARTARTTTPAPAVLVAIARTRQHTTRALQARTQRASPPCHVPPRGRQGGAGRAAGWSARGAPRTLTLSSVPPVPSARAGV